VLFVVSNGIRFGGRKSLWANGGILTGNAFYFALSAIGLGAIIAASHEVFLFIKYLGAAYLIYVGVRTMFGGGFALRAGADIPEISGPRILGRGFLLQAANPKALLFFTALLPQFVNPAYSIPLQMLIFGATSMVAEFFVLAMYGWFAGRAAAAAANPRFTRATNVAAGGLLVAAGTGLALQS
jgi:threonine/homoserine/homoserine lactone efflux protein